MSRNTIIHGDCIREMNRLPAESVELAFADPPFNIGFSYDVYADELPAEKYLAWSRDWMRAVHRLLKPNGTFWLAIGDEYAAELKVAAQQIGFHTRSWVIWYYTFGVNCRAKFTRSHAHLFHFVKDPDNFVFRSDEPENRIPSARQLVYNDNRANPKGRLPDDTWIIPPADVAGRLSPEESADLTNLTLLDADHTWTLRPQDLDGRFQADEDTWYFPRVAGTFKERAGFHGCQMPEQLLARIIRCCSSPGDLVLDPFSGSGTTVAVAKKLGRDYLAFDLSEDYVRQGSQRLANIRVGDKLDGAAEPLMSAPKTGADRTKKAKQAKGKKPVPTAGSQPPSPQLELTLAGIVRAFAETHQGHSADRVVADPQLNASYLAACRRLGVAGDSRAWNMLLFRVRKAGGLAAIQTTQRTNLTWQDCDPFLHGSEIAWQELLDQQLADSLDEILCDPVLAEEFDRIAARFAPGFDSLHYRWGALKMRKQASVARERSQVLPQPPRFGQPVPLVKFQPRSAPEGPGLYMVGSRDSKRGKLYVGEAVSLHNRLSRQFGRGHHKLWREEAEQRDIDPKSLAIWVRPLRTEPCEMLAWQTRLVRQFHPLLNLRVEE